MMRHVLVPTLIMTVLTVLAPTCRAHGRLMDPPARNSMWRLGFNNPVNYNDNELYCGGRMVQWLRNSGKCGVCGDPFHGKNDHEAGGKYANGIITRSFHEGDELPVTVHLTANHLGWFEFRICPVNDPKKKVTQQCLDKNELKRADGKGTKYFVPKGKYNAFFNYTLLLPEGLTCKQCVIQWKYRTGNTWDKDDKSGLFCLGCGPQEEFYNCADIEILPKGEKSKWNKDQNMRPTTTEAPPEQKQKPMLKKIHKPIKIVVDSKHDEDKKNSMDKYDHKTTLPAPSGKTSKSKTEKPKPKLKEEKKKAVVKTSKANDKDSVKSVKSQGKGKNSVDNHPNPGQGKKKVKHPQNVKYNWRASTPWLLRRKFLNRRRLGLKQRPMNTNSLNKNQQKTRLGHKVQNEPDTTKRPEVKTTTTARPTTKKIVTLKQTVPTTPMTTTVLPTNRRVTKMRTTATKPTRKVTKMQTTATKSPKKHVIRGPSKSWLISSRKRQNPYRRPSSRMTTRQGFGKTMRPGFKLTTQPVRQQPEGSKTTAHNCVTESPQVKPLKKTVKPQLHQDANVPRTKPKSNPKTRPTTKSDNMLSTHRSTPSITNQRVVSYHPSVTTQHQRDMVTPVQQGQGLLRKQGQVHVRKQGQVHVRKQGQELLRKQGQRQEQRLNTDHQNHAQMLTPSHESQRPMLTPSHQGQMLNQGQQSQGQYSSSPVMWWNQYQRPVSYFWNRPAVTPMLKCRATITLGGGMDEWCTANCNANFCPGGMCICQPDTQPAYPSYSMYPPHTQGWGNTFSPALSQFNNEPSQPESLSPFAPRRHLIRRKQNRLQQNSIRQNSMQPIAMQQGTVQQNQMQQNQMQQNRMQQNQMQQNAIHQGTLPQNSMQQNPLLQQNSLHLNSMQQNPLPHDSMQQMTRQTQLQQSQMQQSQRQPMRTAKQYRPDQLQRTSSLQTSNSIFGPASSRSPVLTTPHRGSSSVWAQKGKYYCRATGRYAGLKRFDEWCSKNCMNVICPLLICECNTL